MPTAKSGCRKGAGRCVLRHRCAKPVLLRWYNGAGGLPAGKLDAVKATVSGAKTGKVTGAYVGDLDAFYANCTTPVLFPVMLQQNFINHAQAIIDGSEDVAAAVAGVQSDLALYLAEQK